MVRGWIIKLDAGGYVGWTPWATQSRKGAFVFTREYDAKEALRNERHAGKIVPSHKIAYYVLKRGDKYVTSYFHDTLDRKHAMRFADRSAADWYRGPRMRIARVLWKNYG